LSSALGVDLDSPVTRIHRIPFIVLAVTLETNGEITERETRAFCSNLSRTPDLDIIVSHLATGNDIL
jgi:hypothetical protein